MQGWIKDYRKEMESDIWSMPPLYHRVWQYLKYKVNHKTKQVPGKNGKTTVYKGETITSLRQIAERVKWLEYGVERVPSAKTIREILNWLEKEEMITRESNKLGTRISIVNFDVYQGSENGVSNTEETQRKHGLPTNKNDKNVNNKNKYTHDELEVLNTWNEKNIIKHDESVNMQKEIYKALKKYSKKNILEAITNYAKAYHDTNFYYSHRWRLDKFLTQKNGMVDWIEGGQRYIDYLDGSFKKEEPKPQCQMSRREQIERGLLSE